MYRTRPSAPNDLRVAYRRFLLDSQGTPYRRPSAELDRMVHNTRRLLPRFGGRPVRSAEVVVDMMNARAVQVLLSVFNLLTFKSDGTLVPPLRDRHVGPAPSWRAR